NPIVFHTGSLLLHVACVLLVFVILRKLFKHDKAACAGTLLFGLHPVQVESVVWISETRGLLCAMFSLLAVWQYLNHTARDRPSENKFADGTSSRPAIIPYCVATACFAAALLCKPAAVAVPLIVVALDWGLLRRPWRRVVLAVTPWLVLAAGWVVLTKQLQPDKLLAEVEGRPLVARAVDAALASKAEPVIVVTGYQARAVVRALADRPLIRVHNPDFADGMGTSLACAIEALPETADGAIICLADMPRIAARHLEHIWPVNRIRNYRRVAISEALDTV
ncbi:hypothetical protein LCGC14_3027550, partial [marine sediment metagenome]